MKKLLIAILVLLLVIVGGRYLVELVQSFANQTLGTTIYKPMIYLYPEQETEVQVKVDYDGTLTTTYPEYKDGWNVTAYPDGTLKDVSGRAYYGLFWEGVSNVTYDTSKGFVVAGHETRAFLETALRKLGLNDREANEFIVFWLPQMEQNPYNFIAFQGEAYTETARLNITPQPDSVLRVFMAWKGLEKPMQVEPQVLTAPERKGFTVVEWGGSILN